VEYRQRIEEMERLLLVNTEKENSYGSQLSLLQSLPSVMTNVHDFFIHVAAEVSTFQWLSAYYFLLIWYHMYVGFNGNSSIWFDFFPRSRHCINTQVLCELLSFKRDIDVATIVIPS
jgi:hypothetical protein